MVIHSVVVYKYLSSVSSESVIFCEQFLVLSKKFSILLPADLK